MSIYDTSFDDLTEHDLLELRTAGVHEGRSIDYKVQLPGNAESDKRELRCDVTSFANADGGHIVFGVVENHGAPVSLPGLGGINPDREIQRLDSIVQTSIDPKLQAIGEAAVIDELAAKSAKFGVSQGALVAMTPQGAVRAKQAIIATNSYSDLTGATAHLQRTLIRFAARWSRRSSCRAISPES